MKKICIGILAHVDAGKTTLSEAILYSAGVLKTFGRVDKRNTFLDNEDIERKRGITVFSKQARFTYMDVEYVLLDTPGHVDFGAEMERTLQVLDYAILVISGSEGVQSHTRTLWRLLKVYNIPTFIYVNKMDMPDVTKEQVFEAVRASLCDECIDFSSEAFTTDTYESMAMSDEQLLEKYLNGASISDADITALIKNRKIFPTYFGSALKLVNVETLLAGISKYSEAPQYGSNFSATVYKIARDEKKNRLTHMKITGGYLQVRDIIGEDKVSQIRFYSGEKYETAGYADAGSICTVLGLEHTRAGELLGDDGGALKLPVIEPVLKYNMLVPDGVDAGKIYPDIVSLGEEIPELDVSWDEKDKQISIKIMGLVQLEIIAALVEKRFGFLPDFDMGQIEYKETIAEAVVGVGHFEPLRHYAEVHVLLEPGERGSGISFDVNCSTDILSANWQKHIISCLRGKLHRGVLTGSPLTDVKITLINGRAHDKHTVGGDFRQAAYRAVRQGLMKASSVLLEPYYDFELTLPSDLLGKAMTDLDLLRCSLTDPALDGDTAVIRGSGPVITLREYQENISEYTRGLGNISCMPSGYFECHNQNEIIETCGYDPEADLHNMSSSVFCAHGAGFIVPWYEVEQYMHVTDDSPNGERTDYGTEYRKERSSFDYSIGVDEIDEIINKTAYSNQNAKRNYQKKKIHAPEYKTHFGKPQPRLPKLLIVDGYNVIFAWEDLKELADLNMDSAKDRLLSILANYKGMTDYGIIVVFDGYKLKNNPGSENTTDEITVIYTKEGETADQYIEKFTNSNQTCYNITVASSDGLIQQITRGQNCTVLSSRELKQIILDEQNRLRDEYDL
ncbi:MAG: NYN domain-containing protein [Clostridium sp.]|nr:NYN domain-containing protein [Clostridium sp.]MCM1398789.1 NYN domain-containing protein [Clostridium sp.]MCM1458579.1 NYN domain-containing protein [Bacteroides sp.]